MIIKASIIKERIEKKDENPLLRNGRLEGSYEEIHANKPRQN